MTTPFATALAITVGIEGGFSKHPSDSGGATKYGITEKLARAYGYTGDMRDLQIEFATRVYREHFWDVMHLDEVSARSISLAEEIFDTGVNTGTVFAITSLQRALNVLNRRGVDYADITVDGLMGRMTLNALDSLLKKRGSRGELVLLRILNALQAAHYVTLAERREKDEDFMFGWVIERVVI